MFKTLEQIYDYFTSDDMKTFIRFLSQRVDSSNEIHSAIYFNTSNKLWLQSDSVIELIQQYYDMFYYPGNKMGLKVTFSFDTIRNTTYTSVQSTANLSWGINILVQAERSVT